MKPPDKEVPQWKKKGIFKKRYCYKNIEVGRWSAIGDGRKLYKWYLKIYCCADGGIIVKILPDLDNNTYTAHPVSLFKDVLEGKIKCPICGQGPKDK